MVKSSTSIKRILLGISFALGASCSQDSIHEEAKCNAPYLAIISTTLSDAEFRDYASSHFERNEEMTVIWDNAPSNARSCMIARQDFTIAKSSALYDGKTTQYVVVTKMYYDDSAAFVELMLLPTGKSGDFFLRNMGGWKVAQKQLWETKGPQEPAP